MAKRCKYIYKGKTYTKEEFMAMLAGGEYENLLAEYEVPSTNMTGEDFADIESSGILGTGTISVKAKASRSKYIDSLSLERLPVHENVTVTTNVNPATLNGQMASSTLSDKLIAGVLRGKDSAFKFLGGIGYAPATGRWWAFSRLSDAEKLINSTEISKDGYKYLIPALMSDTSHLSNKNMTIMVMNLFKEAAANKELNTKQFKALVNKTFDKVDLARHKPYITKVMEGHTKINELIEDIQDAVVSGELTFEDRKAMISSFVGDSIVNKPKFKTVGTITELASDLAEPMAKDVPLHNAVVVYRTKGDLKAVETSKDDEFYHESYGFHIESSSDIEVMYLDGAYPITDLIPEFTTKGTKKNPPKTYRTDEEVMSKIAKGWTVERALTNLGRTHGLSSYSAPINIKPKSKQSKGIGKFDPLPDAPKTKGITGPDPNLVSVAENYAKKFGIPFTRQAEYVKVDEDRAKRIADAYENMKHDPKNPKVLEAFNDLIRQTKDQYDALTEAGYEFSFFDGDTDPYNKNPSEAMRDLRNNKKMAVYGTYAGYGTEGITGASIEGNPMLQDTGLKWKDQNGVDQTVTMNDLFRAVHDAFGHGLEGAGFRARGEENAWQAHVRLFTGPAVAAITTETRGQNSWLNYGPFGEQNRKATVDDTVFAEQKTGLMPEWTWNEGKAEAMPEQVDDQDTQAVADSSALFEKSQELFEKISDAAGGSKKRSLAEERRKFMDENPDIKFMDENMAYIYRQIEDNNLGKKEGNCPL